MSETLNIKQVWIDPESACTIAGMSRSWLGKKMALREIDPSCGRKFGRRWRFKRSVVEEHGIVLRDPAKSANARR